jgi:hypothetical protein
MVSVILNCWYQYQVAAKSGPAKPGITWHDQVPGYIVGESPIFYSSKYTVNTSFSFRFSPVCKIENEMKS